MLRFASAPRLLAAAALALALTPGAAAAPAAPAVPAVCPGADTSAVGASLGAMRVSVVCLINQQRALHHLPPLRANSRLDSSAQNWSETMVRLDEFTHGQDFTSRIDAVGYDWSNAGENIATGFETPRAVVVAWMASLDHCQNILNPGYADVGTGVDSAPMGSYGPATWTQDFGLTMGTFAPSGNTGPMHGCPYRVS